MKNYKFFKHSLIFFFLGILIAFIAFNSLHQKVSAKEKTYESLKIFTEVLSLVESNYVEDVPSKQLVEGAINGMLKSLDPHSAYMSPEVFKEMQVETEGQFGGLGIEITIKDEQLTVVSPIDDTPAHRAGIKAGDKIIKINGTSTKNITIMEAVKKLRGPKGTKVTITVLSEGEVEPREITITRDIIKIKSVKQDLFDGKIGYVKIRSFQKTTDEELDKALADLEKNNIEGLILDLRNNPGGLLQQAVGVSDRFLPGGDLIVYTKGRKKDQNMRFMSNDKGAHLKYPVVVLVNAGSASASEIVAGAFQDLDRAIVLGTTTFGKGSVQTIIPLSDGSGLRLTTAKYYTPKGRLIQGKGIVPDIIVEDKPIKTAKLEDKEKPKRTIREKDLKNHLKGEETPGGEKEIKPVEISKDDPQLERAIGLLKGWEIFKGTIKKPAEKTETQVK